MDFSLSSDQLMLRDSVRRYLQHEYDYQRRTAILRDGGFSAKVWQDFASFGWLGAALPEDMGGYGGGPEEAGILMEGFGRHIVLEPFLQTVLVGGVLIRHGSKGERRLQLSEQLVSGSLQLAVAALEDDTGQGFSRISTAARANALGWTLHGRKGVVPNGGIADKFFVTALTDSGVTLFLIDRAAVGLKIRNFRSNDGQTVAELILDGVQVTSDDLIGQPGGAVELLTLAADHGCAALCSEVVGSTAYLVETTCEYLKVREQFGAPLIKFQVLQHKLADMYIAVELARSMAHVATAALGKPARERMREVSAARLQSIRTARLVARDAVQLHGGMGVSEELDVSAHFVRLSMSTLQFGDEAFHLTRFAALSDMETAAQQN